jgi:hypothetical protein
MFVNDPPPAILFTKAHGEAELQFGGIAARRNINATADRSNKTDVLTCSDLDIIKIEGNWSHLRLIEQLPGLHVCIESATVERGWDIEH